jgi:CRISPR-associated protein Csx17
VARAVASVGAGTQQPILVNIHGVEVDIGGGIRFPGDRRLQRAVWHAGAPLRMLAAMLERRLIDTKAVDSLPLGGPSPCNADLVAAFLADALDVEEIARWIPPLSLINWRRPHRRVVDTSALFPDDGAFLLHALFRPLFHPSEIYIEGEVLFQEHLQPRAVTARRLLHLLRGEAWEEAARIAQDRYLAAGRATVALPSGLCRWRAPSGGSSDPYA